MEMKNHIILSISLCLVLILNVAESFDYDAKELETEEGMEAMYDRWRAHHKVTEVSPERFNTFKATAQFVHNHNKLKNQLYKVKLNAHAADPSVHTEDLTLPGPGCPAASGGCPGGCPANIPPRVDWRDTALCPKRVNHLTGVGASIMSIEAINTIRTGQKLPLSEQMLSDCKPPGCLNFDRIFTFAKDTGIAGVETYPRGGNKQCDKSKFGKTLVTIDGYDSPFKDGNEEVVMKAVAEQPLVFELDTPDEPFKTYAGGIYSGPCGGTRNVMLLAGYDQDPDGTKYWIATTTQFGDDWGEKGYMRILRTPEGLCGMYSFSIRPLKSLETRNIEL